MRLPNPPLRNSGRWIMDNDGLVVIVRGVNMMNKFPPHTLSATGFGEEDAQILAANGLNVVRVGVIYSAVEPSPGVYDDEYLRNIKDTVNMLASYNIMSLIDFHQDGWGPAFGCEGFPEWATLPPGSKIPPIPFPELMETPEVKAAFDNFWINASDPTQPAKGPIQDRFRAAWVHAVSILKDANGILGWELLNEPNPGNSAAWQLQGFTQLLVDAIRGEDTDHMIFYEPWVTFDFGIQTEIGTITDSANRIGFAFHNYMNLDAEKNIKKLPYETAWQNAIDYAGSNEALLATEFGGDVGNTAAELITAQMESIDSFMLPAIYWAYWNRTPYQIFNGSKFVDPADMGLVQNLKLPRTDGNLHVDRLAALVRPYPMFIAGTPRSWSFDPVTKIFDFSYDPFTSGTANVTEIFLPNLHYPHGKVAHAVAADGEHPTVVYGPQSVQIQTVGVRSTVTVKVTPA